MVFLVFWFLFCFFFSQPAPSETKNTQQNKKTKKQTLFSSVAFAFMLETLFTAKNILKKRKERYKHYEI